MTCCEISDHVLYGLISAQFVSYILLDIFSHVVTVAKYFLKPFFELHQFYIFFHINIKGSLLFYLFQGEPRVLVYGFDMNRWDTSLATAYKNTLDSI